MGTEQELVWEARMYKVPGLLCARPQGPEVSWTMVPAFQELMLSLEGDGGTTNKQMGESEPWIELGKEGAVGEGG